MVKMKWQGMPLIERVRWLRFWLPPFLAAVVVLYQLGVAQTLAQNYGHTVHYGVEIAFYSLVGPVITGLTLIWVERKLREKEQLAQQVLVRTQQLTSLTEAASDAILSLDDDGRITSWNRGAGQMFGLTESAVLNQVFIQLFPNAAGPFAQGVNNFEMNVPAPDGRSLTVDLTRTHLTAPGYGLPVTLIIMRDVTARHEREAMLAEERARIARDLHDGVAQNLYFLALKADGIRQQLADPALKTELKQVGETARQVIREVRRTIYALRPLNWTEVDFLQAIADFVTGFAEQAGWQLSLELDKGVKVPPNLETTLFRLVQESLNNAAKHAAASTVWVKLDQEANGRTLSLLVRDDGAGFDPDKAQSNGLGLKQMKARATAVGGKISYRSQAGDGTEFKACLPLKGAACV